MDRVVAQLPPPESALVAAVSQARGRPQAEYISMKVRHFSGTDGGRGAAGPVYRIHKELLRQGVSSRLWVASLNRREPEIRQLREPNFLRRRMLQLERFIEGRILNTMERAADDYVTSCFSGHDPVTVVRDDDPDIVQLHWIAASTLRLSRLARISIPIVWRMSDMWPFCGVEHCTSDIARFVAGYSRQNRPKNMQGIDVSRWAWEWKRRAYDGIKNLTIVSPSQWLADCARRSALFRDRNVVVIRTGCDTDTFYPRDKEACRTVLDLQKEKLIIVAGAQHWKWRIKGGDLLVDAVNKLLDVLPHSDFQLVLFGDDLDVFRGRLRCDVRYFGEVRSNMLMSILHAAADAFVAPSLQENLANTVLEAMACGTPCITFNIGGMPDAIDHKLNGYLAKPYDADDLAAGILWALTDTTSSHRECARQKIETCFNVEGQGRQFLSLYEQLVSG